MKPKLFVIASLATPFISKAIDHLKESAGDKNPLDLVDEVFDKAAETAAVALYIQEKLNKGKK